MMIHPVRLNGMIIGVRQSYDYFKRIQDRITGFVTNHCKISEKRLLELMMDTKTLIKPPPVKKQLNCKITQNTNTAITAISFKIV